MDGYAQITNLYVAGMAEVLGMSHDAVLERCTIRELLLYTGTIASIPRGETLEPQETSKSAEEENDLKTFENEVLGPSA